MRLQLIMKFVEMALHRCCTSVRFSMQHSRTLGRSSRAGVSPHALVSPGYGRLVGRSFDGIKFLMLFRCAASFTWATRIPSSGQR